MPGRQSSAVVILAGVCLLCLGVLFVQGVDLVVKQLGGAFEHAPEDAEWVLSDAAKALVAQAYEGIGKSKIVDHHVHAISLGQREGEGFTNRSFVNPDLLSWRYPRERLRSRAYFSAAGIDDETRTDELYLARLVRLARMLPQPHRLRLVAVDQRYAGDGSPQPAKTPFYVDNDYVWSLSQAYPELFEPVVSVHPYRKDAIKALKRWAERGVDTVKWLPNLQYIDPAADRLQPYYQALIDNKMTLLTHTGDEKALSGGNNEFGNPLRYRRALEMGVTIIMAHSASDGVFGDPDDAQAKPKQGYEWFIELLANPDYAGKLYGDISGLSHRNRVPRALTAILQHPQVFPNLVYASDYPLPAVNIVIDIDGLAEDGFITAKQVPLLREIYQINPLLFDFVLKRNLRLPHTDLGFPDAVFTRKIAGK